MIECYLSGANEGLTLMPKSRNDYIRQWMLDRMVYETSYMSRFDGPGTALCVTCSTRQAIFRCKACYGMPKFCKDCCLSAHQRLPNHPLESWTGTHYKSCDLDDLGYVLHLGHQGNQCPLSSLSPGESEESTAPGLDEDDNKDEEDEEERSQSLGSAKRKRQSGQLVIVDSMGVFIRKVVFCKCPGAADRYLQLFQEGLFPASKARPQTAITFACLDHFLVDTLECRTSVTSFYTKLRRLTNFAFPLSVPVGLSFLSKYMANPFSPFRNVQGSSVEPHDSTET